ncbi:MAG: hypothetical protein A3K31_13660 [Ignavibacteria bacterium RIFOXYA12_FULL_35_25]|nr:MAG: hypothetical protein A2058_04180 [Ignavibacteria bacterium GWA2_36_19]OGU58619.1 MAG: hypothetical protein A2X60_03810 [Ignavibacteria bacterium GWF2_35_20]OGU80420.1 MAG: hypothetical protein A2254_12255 [Ignavibacteria bacterium RIFOXYA2_FULL_35_9]OGU87096.1 MAG: hypothetical protein A3K31_13660 [Ignavibacteria bacterium RIFOXYA12_FULL_35_25]OGU92411.1 MAG: hypothetical protein A2492_04310 [Ignavibacteria bacterium RIFOXYC12_FULL_35_11]OGU95788.1 MAG: hypothetical protein A2347_04235
MKNISNKTVTYSLLAHINDHSYGIKDLSDIFIPLVKRTLAKMGENGFIQGEHIKEIKTNVDEMCHLDIPFPLLDKILYKISTDIRNNQGTQFSIYNDKSFQINNYIFIDYEEEIIKTESEIEKIEYLFNSYLELKGVKASPDNSLFEFIDKNRIQLFDYFVKKKLSESEKDFYLQAEFLSKIKSDPILYKTLCRIYLGSIISSFLAFEPEELTDKSDKEFVLDTNFIISLLDLNSNEATHTCGKIVEICKRLNYRVTVLDYTIEESKNLIDRTADSIETAFLSKKLDPESIFNACDRRNLSKTDLQRISAILEDTLKNEFSINILYDTSKFRNMAKYSKEYEVYKNVRSTNWSALHDATAVKYIQSKRGKVCKDFFTANCFFVTNTSRDFKPLIENENISELIRAEDLVNILWLTNPNVKLNLNNDELTQMGLSKLISSSLNSKLPSSKIIKELEENIRKYAQHKITDKDIIRVGNRIADKTLTNLEQLNKIADKDPDKFIEKLNEEARKEEKKEKEFFNKLNKMLKDIAIKSDERSKLTKELLQKEFNDARTSLEMKTSEKITALTKDKNEEINNLKIQRFSELNAIKKSYDSYVSKKSLIYLGLITLPPLLIMLSFIIFIDFPKIEWIIVGCYVVYNIITYFYFVITRKQWSLLEFYNTLLDKNKNKIYSKFSFDLEEYHKLEKEISAKDETQTN